MRRVRGRSSGAVERQELMSGIMVRGFLAIVIALAAVASQAELVVSYESGVLPQSGASGAADPTTQAWTFSGAGSGYSNGYDSGDGGWRTLDGTTLNLAAYFRTLTTEQIGSLTTADGWQVTWTLAMDESALLEGGGGVTDYYLAPNNGRQNNIYTILQVANEFNFYLSHRLNSSNEVFIRNENSPNDEYQTGVFIGGSNPFPNFMTFSLTYSAQTDNAILDYVGGTATIANGGNQGNNRVFFGAGTSGGQGSAIWNELTVVTVPEPASLLLPAAGLAGLAVVRRRLRSGLPRS